MATAPGEFSLREATRILNSTPIGKVATEYRLRRLLTDHGMRKPRLLELGAWLLRDRKGLGPGADARHRERERKRQAELSASGRNIGEMPFVQNPGRRKSCREDLGKFIMTYAPEGKDPFSQDHLRVIKRIEDAIFNGGRFVEAVYRGFGKSTISELTAVWAICYGHKKYIPLISANEARATENLESIKGVFESEILSEDFPEICFPVLALAGITQRCQGQLYDGKPTHIEWGSDSLVFPMTPGAHSEEGEWFPNESAGSIITACGITSSKIRGMKKRRRDGVQLRPDFVVIDDPQDEASACSPTQVEKRLGILRKAILKSAGHKTKLSVVMPCTVIRCGDVVDQLLDHNKNPAWQGERIPMVKKWADRHEDLWLGEYAMLRNSYKPDVPGDQGRAQGRATAFYKENRESMDTGCIVSWEHCFEPEREISAIQHAYNALIDDGEEVFASEFQNQPLDEALEAGQLKIEEIEGKLNRLKGGAIPADCEHLTMFVDVQGKLLYYVVTAWSEEFTGYILDYGTYPEQPQRYFTVRQAQRTLGRIFPGVGQEGQWRGGLEALLNEHLGRGFQRDDGAMLRIERCLIDANDGNARNVIYEYCRHSLYPTIVMPSLGRGVKAGNKPFDDYRAKPGDKKGLSWRIPRVMSRGEVRHVIADVNYWKSFVRNRWRTAFGDPGSLSLFGDDPVPHRMFIDHMVSEYFTPTEGRGRRVDEWALKPNFTENHYWDCLVGCAIAASVQGARLPGTEVSSDKRRRRRRKITQSDAK